MTSTTDTAGHPDVAEISDLTEGLLPPDRSTDIRRHLDACELCADVHASLEEIRELLGSAPQAQRMPDDVAERIDAALTAEAILGTFAPDSADAPLSGPDASVHESDDAPVSREHRPRLSVRPAGRTQRPVRDARAVSGAGAGGEWFWAPFSPRSPGGRIPGPAGTQ